MCFICHTKNALVRLGLSVVRLPSPEEPDDTDSQAKEGSHPGNLKNPEKNKQSVIHFTEVINLISRTLTEVV